MQEPICKDSRKCFAKANKTGAESCQKLIMPIKNARFAKKNTRTATMTRNDLEKLRSLKFEIAQLEEELKKPQEPSEVIIAYKDYRHSAKGIPKVDEGLDDGTEVKKKLVDSLQKKLNERIRLANAMENWIDEIEDPEMRVILRAYYGRGIKQEDIAKDLGYAKVSIKQKIHRFWKYKR